MNLEHCAFYLAMNENDWGELIHLMSQHFGQSFEEIKNVGTTKANKYPEIFIAMGDKGYGWIVTSGPHFTITRRFHLQTELIFFTHEA